MTRIAETFNQLKTDKRGGFIPFITAGDPDIKTSVELIVALAHNGADIIEVGVPFSDPVADGVVIQRASERALKQGVTLADVLHCIAQAQTKTQVPVVLFSYFNPLLQYGLERLAKDAKAAGVDGVLVTDLIPEEAGEFNRVLEAHEIDPIYLVAPTTSDKRLKLIAELARGFIYVVSRAGVTGARDEMSRDARATVERVRKFSDLPIAVGFGVSNFTHVKDVWSYADAAVVGSAIVREVERLGADENLIEGISDFVKNLVSQSD